MRPLVYDLTYVVARLHAAHPTGIERVDAAFARHLFGADTVTSSVPLGLHYGLRRPHLLSRDTAQRLVAEASRAWTAADRAGPTGAGEAITRWLDAPPHPAGRLRLAKPKPPTLQRYGQDLQRLRFRLADDARGPVPEGALYLNVAQYAFEYPFFFRWLDRRPDVRPVFFIHDLLPLDHPEFFREGYGALFERRVATMARYASAAIVSNGVVAERVAAEMRARGRGRFPILAEPLPPPALAEAGADRAPATPYFVVLATIEPRKNHLLLLHLWRELARGPAPVPRLLVIGARGWDNEQVLDLLERSRALAPHVLEVSGLDTPTLARLVRGARALLVPSFEEGYGLPIAEALAAGTPVVGSDIPVFQEVSQERALLLEPTDGLGWRKAIQALAEPGSPLRAHWAEQAQLYRSPEWSSYFGRVAQFLAGL